MMHLKVLQCKFDPTGWMIKRKNFKYGRGRYLLSSEAYKELIGA
jgi:hypothetical protein